MDTASLLPRTDTLSGLFTLATRRWLSTRQGTGSPNPSRTPAGTQLSFSPFATSSRLPILNDLRTLACYFRLPLFFPSPYPGRWRRPNPQFPAWALANRVECESCNPRRQAGSVRAFWQYFFLICVTAWNCRQRLAYCSPALWTSRRIRAEFFLFFGWLCLLESARSFNGAFVVSISGPATIDKHRPVAPEVFGD